LKPFVDNHYRKDRANTGIGGSSMGALIQYFFSVGLRQIQKNENKKYFGLTVFHGKLCSSDEDCYRMNLTHDRTCENFKDRAIASEFVKIK
jgi:hypothetical protein